MIGDDQKIGFLRTGAALTKEEAAELRRDVALGRHLDELARCYGTNRNPGESNDALTERLGTIARAVLAGPDEPCPPNCPACAFLRRRDAETRTAVLLAERPADQLEAPELRGEWRTAEPLDGQTAAHPAAAGTTYNVALKRSDFSRDLVGAWKLSNGAVIQFTEEDAAERYRGSDAVIGEDWTGTLPSGMKPGDAISVAPDRCPRCGQGLSSYVGHFCPADTADRWLAEREQARRHQLGPVKAAAAAFQERQAERRQWPNVDEPHDPALPLGVAPDVSPQRTEIFYFDGRMVTVRTFPAPDGGAYVVGSCAGTHHQDRISAEAAAALGDDDSWIGVMSAAGHAAYEAARAWGAKR
jgi:hypothetical protein